MTFHTRNQIHDEIIEILEYFQHTGCPVCGGDCAGANPPMSFCPMERLERALKWMRMSKSQPEFDEALKIIRAKPRIGEGY